MYSLPRFDTDGTCIPFAADDELLECGFDDESWGEPETWEPWTDAHTWELGPETDVTIEPYFPSEDDLADYAEWADRLEAQRLDHERDMHEDREEAEWLARRSG